MNSGQFAEHVAEIRGYCEIALLEELFGFEPRPAAIDISASHRTSEHKHDVAVTVIGLGITPWLARLPSLHANLMVPIVLSVCFVGAYATRSHIEDVLVAAVFGVLGYLMDKYHYSRANFVIGMVLAVMIERNLHISLTLYGTDFLLQRPIALAMLVFVVVTAALPFIRNWRRDRARAAASAETAG